MRVLNQAFGHPLALEEHATDPLAGGLMHGYQCGMLWGAALAAGAQAYRLFGASPQAEMKTMAASQKVVASFRMMNKHLNCQDITRIDMSAPKTRSVIRFLVTSLPTGSCFGMAARYARAAYRDIDGTLSQESDVPQAPMSCSALLANRLGASDMHTMMAAGFAGGIGLSGGACGALGAAVWLISLDILPAGGTLGLKVPRVDEAIRRFKRLTGGEFECEKIVGRQFASVSDHAGYLHRGGCLKIIEALAVETVDPP